MNDAWVQVGFFQVRYSNSSKIRNIKGALCKNWHLVEFILKTKRGQHVARIMAANCSYH